MAKPKKGVIPPQFRKNAKKKTAKGKSATKGKSAKKPFNKAAFFAKKKTTKGKKKK